VIMFVTYRPSVAATASSSRASLGLRLIYKKLPRFIAAASLFVRGFTLGIPENWCVVYDFLFCCILASGCLKRQ
jgi:hypothetical protein